jgi:predicted MFS family arabinose efflux permease
MTKDVLPAEVGVSSEPLPRSLVVAVSLVLLAGVLVFGLLTVRGFNRSLEPELARRASLIGETVAGDTERALEVGIPLDGLIGVDEYFAEFLARFPELDYLAIRGQGGHILFATGDIPPEAFAMAPGAVGTNEIGDSVVYSFPIEDGRETAGSIDVGVDRLFVSSRLQDLALDVGVILIVAMVVAFEVMLALGHRIVGGKRTNGAVRARSVGDVRLVLFLFVVGEELSKSFLPLFIQGADNPTGLEPAIAISLPILAYLLTLAVASPLAGRLVAGFGQRGLFLIGLVAAAGSHLGMVFADNVFEIMGLRALTGVGYALATIASLEYLLERMERGSRARGIGVFVGVVIGGTFAGTALGGIFAERLGYDAVFIISFFIVVAAGVLAMRMMQPGRAEGAARSQSFSMDDVTEVLQHRSLVLLLGGITVPMNVVMAAFLWYLVPLSMAAIGSGASAIARTLMVYYLVILLGGPAASKLADQHLDTRAVVGVGSVLSGAVLLLPALRPSLLTIFVAVLVVGIGHTAVRGPQIALALDIAEIEFPESGRGPVMAAMRGLERLGSLAGLLVVAVLAAQFGLNVAIGAIGVFATVAAVIFLVASTRVEARSPVA